MTMLILSAGSGLCRTFQELTGIISFRFSVNPAGNEKQREEFLKQSNGALQLQDRIWARHLYRSHLGGHHAAQNNQEPISVHYRRSGRNQLGRASCKQRAETS